MRNYRAFVEAEIDEFLRTHVVAEPAGQVRSTDMYAAFSRWWDTREDERLRLWSYSPPEPSQRLFSFVVRERIATKRTADGHVFLGVGIVVGVTLQ